MKDLLLSKSDRLLVQVIRYGFVAIVAFVIDFSLLYVFTQYLGIFYLISATLSFLISLVVNYILSVFWVFPLSSKKIHLQAMIFLAIGLIGLVLNLVIIAILSNVFGLFYLLSKIVAIVVVFFWSFVARHYLFKN